MSHNRLELYAELCVTESWLDCGLCKLNSESCKKTVRTGWIVKTELLKVQENSQFPDEPARYKISQCRLPDVVAIAVIKEIVLEGRLK